MIRFLTASVLVLIVFTSPLLSQEVPPALAILDVTPISVDESQTLIMYGYILDQVHRSGDYRIVERGELNKAMQEMELSASMAVDDSTAVRIGMITGAEFILLSSLATEGGKFYVNMRVVSVETAQVTNTSVKSADSFDKVEKLAKESVKYLLGRKEPQKARKFLTLSTNIGLTVPIGPAADVMGLAFMPTENVDYNLGLAWGVLSFGIATGTNLTSAQKDVLFRYNLYSIPLFGSIGYRSSFNSPLFFLISAHPGVAFNILSYPVSVTEGDPKNFKSTSFFLAFKAGAGYFITPFMGLYGFCSYMRIPFAKEPYLGVTPGVGLILGSDIYKRRD